MSFIMSHRCAIARAKTLCELQGKEQQYWRGMARRKQQETVRCELVPLWFLADDEMRACRVVSSKEGPLLVMRGETKKQEETVDCDHGSP